MCAPRDPQLTPDALAKRAPVPVPAAGLGIALLAAAPYPAKIAAQRQRHDNRTELGTSQGDIDDRRLPGCAADLSARPQDEEGQP